MALGSSPITGIVQLQDIKCWAAEIIRPTGDQEMSSLGIRRLDFVTIYSKDLGASRKFYVDLLEFPVLREVPNEFFQINVAGVPICVDLNQSEAHQNNIGLEVDDLAATQDALRRKGLNVRSGSNPKSKEEWIGVHDPDGNEIIFLLRELKTNSALSG
jgi:catechol 2,3-dioxygenase-like lactoylglutathione lyase family enzyme